MLLILSTGLFRVIYDSRAH